MMCFTICSDKSCPVNARSYEDPAYIHREGSDRSPLCRNEEYTAKTGSFPRAMPAAKVTALPFRNTHIKNAREFLPESVQSGSIWHSSCNMLHVGEMTGAPFRILLAPLPRPASRPYCFAAGEHLCAYALSALATSVL